MPNAANQRRPNLFTKLSSSATGFMTKTLPLALTIAVPLSIASLTACSNQKSAVVNSANASTGEETGADNNAKLVTALQANLKTSGIDAKITSAVPTKMDGVYWVNAESMPPFFSDKQGKYIFQGQIIEVGIPTPKDISADFISSVAQDKLAAVKPEDMVIYAPEGETKGIIYAFTDATCPYCQKFHEDIPELNKKGIEVRYLAWPRNQNALPLMEAVWCSDDKKAAMGLAKNKQMPNSKSCQSPVQAQVELGFSLGVQGTPAIFTQDGQQIGGYLPPAQVAKQLGL